VSGPRRYVPYEELDGRPHVMVDGAARDGSVLTLSHWPQSPTPHELARDVSAEIVLAYLAAGADLAPGAEAVTNDHFDTDGVMSVLALVDPDWALGHAELLVEVAGCGDFGVVRSDEAAKIAFAIEPLATERAGPPAGSSERYGAVLGSVREVVEHPERFERYWQGDVAGLVAGRRALEAGDVVITERPELDLAVVERVGPRSGGAAGGMPVHEAAVNSATPCTRVLGFDGDRCELVLRYEGWVRLVSRPVALRPDLGPLAECLSSAEPGGIGWEGDLVGTIVGRLRPAGDGRSELGPERITEIVADYLRTAPPAWDPFRPGTSYIPPDARARYRPRRLRRRRRAPAGR